MNNIYSLGSTVFLFERNEKGELNIREDPSFRPYFYVENEKGPYKSIYGERLEKIKCSEPYDVFKTRSNYNKTFEADVHYTNRYIIDKIKDFGNDPLRKHFLDIEISNDFGVLDVENAPDSVLGLCVYDNFLDEYHQFIWHEKIKKVYDLDMRKILSAVEEENIFIHLFDSEEEMLGEWMVWERKHAADIWWGWYAGKFDYPYLFHRIGERNINFVSPIEIAREDKFGISLAGIYLGDLLEHYKKLTGFLYGQRESYSLNYISQIELGKGKRDVYTPKMIKKLWKENPEEFIIYNGIDVKREKQIEEKYNISEYINNLRKASHSRFEDTLQYARMIDCFMLYYAHNKNKIVLPTKTFTEDEKKQGPFVYKPEKGLHKDVLVFDSSASYPRIIRSLNLSPETMDEKGEILVNGIRFKKEPLGFVPQVVKNFEDGREEMKNRMFEVGKKSKLFNEFDMKQRALKALANAVIGYFGYRNSRFYNKDIFETVTYIVSYIQKETEKFIREKNLGHKIYGDSDSLFEKIKNKRENLIVYGMGIQKKINRNLDEVVKKFGIEEHCIEYKFEKMYKKLFFTDKKKKYCGLLSWREGERCDEIEIVGFESKRSDTPQATRKFLKKLLELILRVGEKEKIDDFVLSTWNNYKKLPLDVIGFPVNFNKPLDKYKTTPIHIRAIKNAMELGIDFSVGEKFKWVYIIPNIDNRYGVMAFNEIHFSHMKAFAIDYSQMKKRLSKVIGRVYSALDWSVPGGVVLNGEKGNKKMLNLFEEKKDLN